MIRHRDPAQQTIEAFDWPFHTTLDVHNRWVGLAECIPWEALISGYDGALSSTQGRPAKDARLVIGAVIIKHKLCLSDRETVSQIQENPYLQYFVGLPGYQSCVPFVPSLLVDVRKRMGEEVFEVFHQGIIDAVESKSGSARVRDKAAGEAGTETETKTKTKTKTKEAPLVQSVRVVRLN